MADSIGNLNIKVGVDAAPAEGGFKHLSAKVSAFADRVEGVKAASLRGVTVELRATAAAADRAKEAAGGLLDKLKGMAGGALKGGIAGVAAGLTLGLGSVGVGGVGDLFGSSVDLAAQAETAAMSFEVMTGSAEKARRVIADARGYAKESPFGAAEVTAATRGLIAYGVAADAAVPTVRMLGEVAAASGDRAGETLGRLVRQYGQVFTAGRLQGDELNSFAENGVPLADALARTMGVNKAEIKGLVEAGRVGFPQVARAFHSLTAEGGLFFGMTDRRAETFAGTLDSLRSGVDDLKEEFGRALVEELGLKEAARDGEKFAADMRKLVNDVRPAIRFVGELGRGVAQVLGEVVRNAPLFAQALGAGLRKASPELAAYADRTVQLIRDLQNFKLDPDRVIDFAADIGVALGRTIDHLIADLGGGLQGIYDRNVKPIVDALTEAATTWKNIKGLLDGPANVWDAVKWKSERLKMRDEGLVPDGKRFFDDRRANPTLDRWWDTIRKKEFKSPDELRKLGVREEVIAAQDAVRDRMVEVLNTLDADRKALAAAEWDSQFNTSLKAAKQAADDLPKIRARVLEVGRDAADLAKELGMPGALKIEGVNLSAAEAVKAPPPGPLESRARALKDWATEAKDVAAAVRAGRAARDAAAAVDPDAVAFGGLGAVTAADARKRAGALAVLDAGGAATAPAPPTQLPQLPAVVEGGTAEFARLVGEAMGYGASRETAEDLLRQLNAKAAELVKQGEQPPPPQPQPVRLP